MHSNISVIIKMEHIWLTHSVRCMLYQRPTMESFFRNHFLSFISKISFFLCLCLCFKFYIYLIILYLSHLVYLEIVRAASLSVNLLVSAEELGRITEIINDYLRLYLNYTSIFKTFSMLRTI